MEKVLISTLWENTSSIFHCAHKLSVDKIILLVDKKEKSTQVRSVKTLAKKYANIIDVKTIKIELFDVPEIVEECVKLIDSIKGNDIYVHVNDGRRTQTIGLLLAAYIRFEKVKGIYYVLDNDEKLSLELPKLSFDINERQKRLLIIISNAGGNYGTLKNLASKTKQSRPLLYRNLRYLENRGMVRKKDSYVITDAGKIAIL